jgi:putative endonuclease
MSETMSWCVYIILCTDDSLYTGITNNIQARLSQHNDQRGAKYFRGRKPHRIVYLETGHTRSSASQREAQIKKLRRVQKERLIASGINEASIMDQQAGSQCEHNGGS